MANEVQATSNARLNEMLSQTKCGIATITSDPATMSALQHVVEGQCKGWVLIDKRQKLILLADCS